MGNPTAIYLIIEQPTDALRAEAVAALSVFGLQSYAWLVGDIFHTPTNGMGFLELRPLGSKSGWDTCTRHMRYIRFMVDLCDALQQFDCECAIGYALVVFDDFGVKTANSGQPDEIDTTQKQQLTELLSTFDIYDMTARQVTGANGDYGTHFGPADAPEEIERVKAAAHRVMKHEQHRR